MDTIFAPDDVITYGFAAGQAQSPLGADTVFFSAETTHMLTGSYAHIAAFRQIANFSIGIEPQGEISLVHEVLISPRAQENANGIHPSALGWTREETMSARARLNAWAEEWDDPAMDEYNIYL